MTTPDEFISIDGTTTLKTQEDFADELLAIENEISARCRTLYDQRRKVREAMTERFPSTESDCPYCKGRGKVVFGFPEVEPDAYTDIWQKCPNCQRRRNRIEVTYPDGSTGWVAARKLVPFTDPDADWHVYLDDSALDEEN